MSHPNRNESSDIYQHWLLENVVLLLQFSGSSVLISRVSLGDDKIMTARDIHIAIQSIYIEPTLVLQRRD
jgi:hypothetical protein